jgi:tetratricopeptide (TPR) repeat protein
LSLVFLLPLFAAKAQAIKWPNPEVEQLYKSAQASLSAGSYKQAIASYQQAIVLVPDQMILHRDLAQALLLSGNPVRAEQIITPVIEKDGADALSYVIAANVQLALKEEKKARKLLDKGIEKNPQSGFLYRERGKFYEEHGNMPEALQQWVDGIAAEPAFHLNYYDAARAYMQTTNNVWAIVYGEIFVNLERVTPRSAETRKLLLDAYRRFYATPNADISGRKKNASAGPASFEDAVALTLLKLSPVVAEGVNTESLTMLRTRFSMDWMANYAGKYPYALFQKYDDLLREGHFDAYNEWLFGRAENPTQYDAWVKFHPESIPEYEAWYSTHRLQPATTDVYKHAVSKQIFPKSK